MSPLNFKSHQSGSSIISYISELSHLFNYCYSQNLGGFGASDFSLHFHSLMQHQIIVIFNPHICFIWSLITISSFIILILVHIILHFNQYNSLLLYHFISFIEPLPIYQTDGSRSNSKTNLKSFPCLKLFHVFSLFLEQKS